MADNIFGISEKALELCENRSVMLSNNIVNTATPNYKARDIDFRKVLLEASNSQSGLATDNDRHLQASNETVPAKKMYRVPMKENLDGNTVDEELERKNFLQNALNYQVNLTFVKNSSDRLMKAIKGV